MLHLLRVIWILTFVINLFAIIWFILGSTANFQRDIDIISTFIFMYSGIPSIILILLSIYLYMKKWTPSSIWGIAGVVLITLSMLFFSSSLFKNVNTNGWLTESTIADTIQMTTDEKYEYQLELVNLFQKNAYARLYLKSTYTDDEMKISLELPINQIKGISMGKTNYWIHLEPTTKPNLYLLRTTDEFRLRNYIFEINVEKGTAVMMPRIEG